MTKLELLARAVVREWDAASLPLGELVVPPLGAAVSELREFLAYLATNPVELPSPRESEAPPLPVPDLNTLLTARYRDHDKPIPAEELRRAERNALKVMTGEVPKLLEDPSEEDTQS